MPPLGLLYIPLDVKFGRDPKVRALAVHHGVEGFAAAALYVAMACYCKEHLTDGYVPDDEVGVLAYPLPEDTWRRLLGYLLEPIHGAGGSPLEPLVRTASDPQANRMPSASEPLTGGWQVCAYVRRNGTREDAERRAQTNAQAARTRWAGDGRRRRSGRVPSGSHTDGKRIASERHAQTESLTETRGSARDARGAGAGAGAGARDTPTDAWADLGGGAAPANQWTTPPGRRRAPADGSAAGRHTSARTVAEAMSRPDGYQPPATDEQRRKRADDAARDLAERASAAAAERAASEPPEEPAPFTALTPPGAHREPAGELGEPPDSDLPF